jgi:hypothetical protein
MHDETRARGGGRGGQISKKRIIPEIRGDVPENMDPSAATRRFFQAFEKSPVVIIDQTASASPGFMGQNGERVRGADFGFIRKIDERSASG